MYNTNYVYWFTTLPLTVEGPFQQRPATTPLHSATRRTSPVTGRSSVAMRPLNAAPYRALRYYGMEKDVLF